MPWCARVAASASDHQRLLNRTTPQAPKSSSNNSTTNSLRPPNWSIRTRQSTFAVNGTKAKGKKPLPAYESRNHRKPATNLRTHRSKYRKKLAIPNRHYRRQSRKTTDRHRTSIQTNARSTEKTTGRPTTNNSTKRLAAVMRNWMGTRGSHMRRIDRLLDVKFPKRSVRSEFQESPRRPVATPSTWSCAKIDAQSKPSPPTANRACGRKCVDSFYSPPRRRPDRHRQPCVVLSQ